MKISRKILLRILVTLFLFSLSLVAQDLKTSVSKSPLSTAFYLLSKTDKDSNIREKACLANSFAGVEKYQEIERVSELVEDLSYTFYDYVLLATKLFQNGKVTEASKMVSYLIKRSEGDEDNLEKL